MSREVSPSTNRAYGVVMVSRLWRIARATVYRHRRPAVGRRRPGSVGPMPDDELVDAIRDLLAKGPFHGEGYRKIWARLRFAGIRTSKRRVLRLTAKHGLQAPGRVGRPRGPKAHDGTIRTERVDLMWGSDLTGASVAPVQVGPAASVSKTPVQGEPAAIIAEPPVQTESEYKHWVTVDRLNRRTCPSTACGIVGQLFSREAATVYEQKNGWARISTYYDALCNNGRSEYVDSGSNQCRTENGIVDGSSLSGFRLSFFRKTARLILPWRDKAPKLLSPNPTTIESTRLRS